ncbi:MAG: S8 family serine peptidase, partial [Planctomycetota bacterium]
RMKPDVVAPGMALTLANAKWKTSGQPRFEEVAGGCSFAAPHVAGLIAQQLEAGRRLELSVDPRVLKATMLNSAVKVLNKYGDSWTPASRAKEGEIERSSAPLDAHSGAGLVDGRGLAEQYLAGQQDPGLVKHVGWDLAAVAKGQFVEYALDAPTPGRLAATLTWHRHVERVDQGPARLDASDQFVADPLADLDLQVVRDGALVAESVSRADNVEHLLIDLHAGATYAIRVIGWSVPELTTETYALAWRTTAAPEPDRLGVATPRADAASAARSGSGRGRNGASSPK